MQRLPTTSDTVSAWLMAGVLVNLASVACAALPQQLTQLNASPPVAKTVSTSRGAWLLRHR